VSSVLFHLRVNCNRIPIRSLTKCEMQFWYVVHVRTVSTNVLLYLYLYSQLLLRTRLLMVRGVRVQSWCSSDRRFHRDELVHSLCIIYNQHLAILFNHIDQHTAHRCYSDSPTSTWIRQKKVETRLRRGDKAATKSSNDASTRSISAVLLRTIRQRMVT